jgi:hypothetical protein
VGRSGGACMIWGKQKHAPQTNDAGWGARTQAFGKMKKDSVFGSAAPAGDIPPSASFRGHRILRFRKLVAGIE